MKEDAAALAVVDGDYLLSPPQFFIPADTTRYDGVLRHVKRCVDLVLSLLGIIVVAPLMGVVALIIKRSSPGPVLFVQDRLGRDGRPFRFYKFRSMEHNSDDAIHRQFAAMFINGDEDGCTDTNAGDKIFKLKRDPRVTRIGAWLRRTSLDELPQLFNILRGDRNNLLASKEDAVISKNLADVLYPDENPLGKELRLAGRNIDLSLTISGVFENQPANSTFKPDVMYSAEWAAEYLGTLFRDSSFIYSRF